MIIRTIHGPTDLGRLFFFAEFAIAVAGWVLGINPFDQPNVQEAKDATKRVLEEGLGDQPDADDDALRALLSGLGAPHYLATMGYVEPSAAFDAAVTELRAAIRDATRSATTFGYGPRFLHSTGQLHKGGPPAGRFLQIVHDSEPDVEIPGADYGFTRAQARPGHRRPRHAPRARPAGRARDAVRRRRGRRHARARRPHPEADVSTTVPSTPPAVVGDNPLVEGLERLPVHPTNLAIFGATGDLSKRKLLPALYNLAHDGALPERFNLVGISRSEMTDEEFRKLATEAVRKFSRRTPDDAVLKRLFENARYVAGTFDQPDLYGGLEQAMQALRRGRRTSA